MLDLKKWTLADVMKFEELSGLSIEAISQGMNGKALTALIYIVKNKEDSKFTYEAASRVTVEEMEAIVSSFSDGDTAEKN
jgi:hypothetical protein